MTFPSPSNAISKFRFSWSEFPQIRNDRFPDSYHTLVVGMASVVLLALNFIFTS